MVLAAILAAVVLILGVMVAVSYRATSRIGRYLPTQPSAPRARRAS